MVNLRRRITLHDVTRQFVIKGKQFVTQLIQFVTKGKRFVTQRIQFVTKGKRFVTHREYILLQKIRRFLIRGIQFVTKSFAISYTDNTVGYKG